VSGIYAKDRNTVTERRIRISQRTSSLRHVKVLLGKLSLVQAARLANQLGGREAVWFAVRLVCWLARWTCCSNFAPFGNLSFRISLPPPPPSTVSLPSASLSGPCHSRITALGPAFRVLEYYRARHEAAPRHPPLSSHPPSPLLTPPYHCRFSCAPTSTSCWLPSRSPSA